MQTHLCAQHDNSQPANPHLLQSVDKIFSPERSRAIHKQLLGIGFLLIPVAIECVALPRGNLKQQGLGKMLEQNIYAKEKTTNKTQPQQNTTETNEPSPMAPEHVKIARIDPNRT